MVKRYNPPPGWQVPGEGWRPPLDWRPDPAWPPAPVGWNFWLDQEHGPAPLPARALRGVRRLGRGYLGVAALVILIAVVGVTAAVSSFAGRHGSVRFTASPSHPAPTPPPTAVLPTSTPSVAWAPTGPAPTSSAGAARKVAAQPTVRPRALVEPVTRPVRRPVAGPTAKSSPTGKPMSARPAPSASTPPATLPGSPSAICDPIGPRTQSGAAQSGAAPSGACTGGPGNGWTGPPVR